MAMIQTNLLLQFCLLLACGAAGAAAVNAAADTGDNDNDSSKPNILMIVVDDLGSHDLGFISGNIDTPNIDNLRKDGVHLTNYYVQRLCSPTRASFLSGRYAIHHGVDNWIPSSVAWAVPSDNMFIPGKLKEANYSTHVIGKWHVGFAAEKYTPTFRGFDSFFGFYSGVEDYFTHKVSGGYDMRHDVGPNCGAGCSEVVWNASGTYSTELFTTQAEAVINSLDQSTPFFMYLAYQGVHAPQEVPDKYLDPYLNKTNRPHFSGMVTAVDEGIGNVTALLKQKGMMDNTIIVVTADNGGPVSVDDTIGHFESDAIGASNYPRRGGKHLLFDGGVRVTSIIHAPQLIPTSSPDTDYPNLMHASDWWATFADFAGLEPTAPSPYKPIDGVSHAEALKALSDGAAVNPPRTHIPLDNQTNVEIDEYGYNAGIVSEGWKLIIKTLNCGWSVPEPNDKVNGTNNDTEISGPMLFDLVNDPEERTNLYDSNPTKVAQLSELLVSLSADRFTWPIHKYPNGKPTNGSWAPWLPNDAVP